MTVPELLLKLHPDEAFKPGMQFTRQNKGPIGFIVLIVHMASRSLLKLLRKPAGLTTVSVFALSWYYQIHHYVLGLFLTALIILAYRFFQSCRRRISTELDSFPNIKKLPYYQDSSVLENGWSREVAHTSYKGRILYQPREGYCGHATINTVLHSVSSSSLAQPLIELPPVPKPLSLKDVHKMLNNYINEANHQFADNNQIEKVEMFHDMDAKTFHHHMTQLNNPRYRYMANFLRTQLFFADPTDKKPSLFQRLLSGHWSPLIAFVEAHDSCPHLVMVADVNEKYGTYLCPMNQLYHSINTTSLMEGIPRGLIRITLKSN